MASSEHDPFSDTPYRRKLTLVLGLKHSKIVVLWSCPATVEDGQRCSRIRPARYLYQAGESLEVLAECGLVVLRQLSEDPLAPNAPVDQILGDLCDALICEDHRLHTRAIIAGWKAILRGHALSTPSTVSTVATSILDTGEARSSGSQKGKERAVEYVSPVEPHITDEAVGLGIVSAVGTPILTIGETCPSIRSQKGKERAVEYVSPIEPHAAQEDVGLDTIEEEAVSSAEGPSNTSTSADEAIHFISLLYEKERQKASQLADEIEQLRDQVQQLGASLSSAKANAGQDVHTRNLIRSLRADLSKKNADMDLMTAEISRLKSRNQDLQGELSHVEQQLEWLKEDYITIEEQNSWFEDQNTELEDQNAHLLDRNERLEEVIQGYL